jgi:hypothetical protein
LDGNYLGRGNAYGLADRLHVPTLGQKVCQGRKTVGPTAYCFAGIVVEIGNEPCSQDGSQANPTLRSQQLDAKVD